MPEINNNVLNFNGHKDYFPPIHSFMKKEDLQFGNLN